MPRATTRRPAAIRALASAGLAVALLSGCTAAPQASGTGPSPTASSTPTTTAKVGIDWKALPASGPLHKDGRYRAFSAANTLWAIDQSATAVLNGTTDGKSWRSIDLSTHGLPADAKLSAGTGGCFAAPAIERRKNGFTLVYYTYYKGSNPEGLLDKIWIVDVDGDAVSVNAGPDNGFENMPPDSGGESFRTMCVAGFTTLNGTRVAVGEGQWWKPYSTSAQNAFTAAEGSAGQWEVYSTKSSEFLGSDYVSNIYEVLTFKNSVGALAVGTGQSSFDMWWSTDGREWARTEVPGKPAQVSQLRAAIGPAGIVVAAPLKTEPGTLHVWFSPDGTTWQEHELLATDGTSRLGAIVTLSDGFLVTGDSIGSAGIESFAWRSADGVSWKPVTNLKENFYVTKDPIAHKGGLVSVSGYGIRVSGLDW